MIYKFLIRPVLFLFKPETIHDFVFFILPKVSFLYPLFRLLFTRKSYWESITIGGLKFKNRLGIAAGLDKDGAAIRFFDSLGFSHIEVGTVTPLPQEGNPKPRLFRLVKDSALINRMGFNNQGAEKIRVRILKAKKKISDGFVIGVNIGKNKNTSLEDAVNDYVKCLEALYDAADFFTINISSPNTENLRTLQNELYLDELLQKITDKNSELSKHHNASPKPLFLKIAPDLTEEEVESIFILAVKHELTGIAATNTTISRAGLISDIPETGGLSGKPLKAASDKVLRKLYDLNYSSAFGKLQLIGAGGVFTQEDYKDKLRNGADLVQVYTGFIYEGMGITKKILK